MPRVLSGWRTRKASIAATLIILVVAMIALTFGNYGIFTPPGALSSKSDPHPPWSTTTQARLSTTFTHTLVRYSGLSLLRTSGTQIVDQYGNIVVLRGVDLTGFEYVPPILSVHPHYKSDYAKIASWGFNVVRLPISWENLEPQPGQYNDSYLRMFLDRDIAWAKQYGIYIVLDMHQVCWSSHFASCNGLFSAGMPTWLLSSYPDSDDGVDAFLNDFFSGLGPNGTTPSPSNPSMLTRFYAAWQHVASRYNKETTIAAYDILNEPPPTTPQSFYVNATTAIRAVDQSHICLWETDVPIELPNIIYSPHYPQDSLTSYNATSLKVGIQQIVDYSKKWNVPIFIGEWGMQADGTGVAQYIQDALSFFDSYSISSAWWDYARGGFTMDLFYDNGSARQILVQNLIRPFISELTSPIIQTSTFTLSTGSFTYSEMLNAAGPSQIQVSIPTGYSIAKIQTSSISPVRSQSISNGRALLLTFPSATSTVIVKYTSRPA